MKDRTTNNPERKFAKKEVLKGGSPSKEPTPKEKLSNEKLSKKNALNESSQNAGNENREIERKYLVRSLPENLEQYPRREIQQAYLCANPVVRIRKQDQAYFLTYKGEGLMVREEYNLPLTREAYEHLLKKADGLILTKSRYLLPLCENLTLELDVFHGDYEGLYLAEVEFSTIEEAEAFTPPSWLGEDVTFSSRYHNSSLSQRRENV